MQEYPNVINPIFFHSLGSFCLVEDFTLLVSLKSLDYDPLLTRFSGIILQTAAQ